VLTFVTRGDKECDNRSYRKIFRSLTFSLAESKGINKAKVILIIYQDEFRICLIIITRTSKKIEESFIFSWNYCSGFHIKFYTN